MALIRSKNTKPEMLVRRFVHALGYRFRLHARNLPGKPDMVFAGKKKVIFVHGCFWHQHSDPSCRVSHVPKSNAVFWSKKLYRNQQRDEENIAAIKNMNWQALVIWECQLKDLTALEERIRSFLDQDRA